MGVWKKVKKTVSAPRIPIPGAGDLSSLLPDAVPGIPLPCLETRHLPAAVAQGINDIAQVLLSASIPGLPVATITGYLVYLESQARGKLKDIPEPLRSWLAPHFRNPLSEVKYAEGINTVHGQAITIEDHIFFPRGVDFSNEIDLMWLIHEVTHTEQYWVHGGLAKMPFLAKYGLQAFQEVLQKRSFNVHDDIRLEQEAIHRTNTVKPLIWPQVQAQPQGAFLTQPDAPEWMLLDNNPATSKIVVDGGELYQLHSSGWVWKYVGPPMTGWQPLDNNQDTKQITVSDGNLYQIHKSGKIWKYIGPPMTGWQLLDDNPASVAIAASGNDLYQLHNNGRIWKYVGPPMTGWQELDNNPATKQIVAARGNLYQMHQGGAIWKYVGPPMTGWQQLDNNPATASITADGPELYQLHDNGRIWKYVGPPMTGWQELDNNPATKQIVAARGKLFQIHRSGLIWKYVGPPLTGWQMLDDNPASVEIVAGASLFQLHNNGLIWEWTRG